MTKLVLVRHGQSQWNLENRFTGWVDVGLTAAGVREAKKAGKMLAKEGVEFDMAFTSYQKRAIKTLWLGQILPFLRASANTIISAHGNSLRALLKRLFDVSDKDIPGFEFPTGNPLLIDLEDGTLNIKSARYLDKKRAKDLPDIPSKDA